MVRVDYFKNTRRNGKKVTRRARLESLPSGGYGVAVAKNRKVVGGERFDTFEEAESFIKDFLG